jgi:hypothetical protein
MTYVSKEQEGKIMEGAARCRRIQDLLNELSRANLKKLLEKQ